MDDAPCPWCNGTGFEPSPQVAEPQVDGWPLYSCIPPPARSADALDTKRLDWLERAGDVSFSIVIDAPHDGEFSLYTDVTYHDTMYGKSLREAIDAAIAQAAREKP